MTALVIHAQDDELLLADTDNDTLFFPGLTQAKILNQDGKEVPATDLEVGDVVEIIGDNAMTMSYPAQYPGISQIKIQSRGNTSDVAKYEGMLATIYPAVDPNTVPPATLDFRTNLGNITVAMEAYNYQGFANGDTVEQQNINGSFAYSSGILSEVVADINISALTNVNVVFGIPLQSATVNRQSVKAESAQRLHIDDNGNRQFVESTIVEGGILQIDAEPGYVYDLAITFENGEAHYAFVAVSGK